MPSRITAVSRQEAARTGPGHQARPLPRPAALRDPLMTVGRPHAAESDRRARSCDRSRRKLEPAVRPPPNRKSERDSAMRRSIRRRASARAAPAALLFAVSADDEPARDGARLSRAAADHDRDAWAGASTRARLRARCRSSRWPLLAEPPVGLIFAASVAGPAWALARLRRRRRSGASCRDAVRPVRARHGRRNRHVRRGDRHARRRRCADLGHRRLRRLCGGGDRRSAVAIAALIGDAFEGGAGRRRRTRRSPRCWCAAARRRSPPRRC